MNDGKSIDETQAPESLGEPHGPDLRRRRLIRGAASIAPVVITLRSGALAASSCVNTKATVTTGDGGVITGYTSGSAGAIGGGDNCIAPYFNTANNGGTCPAPSIDSKLVQPASTQQGTVTGTSPDFKCELAPNTNVAIVSASVTSFAG